ncbi:MAG: TniQ family protein [Rhodocyclaceae bacterium]|nr:TniQ family protein [Rhodocyclaceae bacterium]
MDASPSHRDPLTRDLFDLRAAYLPAAFGNETLYSWCARFHRLSGRVSARQTSRILFDDPLAGLHHDFPTRLDQFCRITASHLGSVERLIPQYTLYRFYAPFLKDQLGQQVVQAMRSGASPGPRSLLGLPASKLGTAAPLKACPECMLEDHDIWQIAWWHLEHQWQSARICPRHEIPLLIARDELHARTLKHWWLPEDLNQQQWVATPEINPAQLNTLSRIVEWTSFLVRLGSPQFDQSWLRYTYLLQAKKRRWVAMDGSVRLQSLRDAFAVAHHGLEHQPGLAFLGSITDINGGFLGTLLRKFPSARHPVKHIYLMAFLFEEPAEFLDLYRQVKSMAESGGSKLLVDQLRVQIVQLRRMIEEEGLSVNAAAKELGVAPTQAIRHLDSEGISYKKRPRVLSPQIEKRLQILLKAGKARQEISSELCIRTGFIKDYLANHPQIKSAWVQAWREKQRKSYRKHFLGVLKDNPGIPMNQIKRISGNGFQWLYRNDKEWLTENLPTVR